MIFINLSLRIYNKESHMKKEFFEELFLKVKKHLLKGEISMLEITHKIHTVLNDLKGYEAGYSTKDLSVLFIRTLNDNKVYLMKFTKLGETSKQDMNENLDSLPRTEANPIFSLVTKISDILEQYKDFCTGYTTDNKETFLLDYKNDISYKAGLKYLGEGTIQHYIKHTL